MVAFPIRRSLKLPLAPLSAIVAAAFVAGGCLLMPGAVLETAMLDSGIPALFPAAEPPLGLTARLALAVTAGAGAAAAAWFVALLILGGDDVVTLRPRAIAPEPVAKARVPVLRRADAHPDAPPRAPLLATRELGVPFLDVRAPRPPVEADLPRDLDAPLSAFDPDAIPAVPVEPVRAVAPLYAPGERFEAFELRPPVRPAPEQPPIAAPRTDATIHALLDRLERGVARKIEPAREHGLEDTLSDLRRMAAR